MEVSGRAIPFSSFAAVGGQFQGAAIGAVKCFVEIQECLYVVFTRFEVAEAADRIAEKTGVGLIDCLGLARLPIFDIEAKGDLGFWAVIDLESGFFSGIG